MDLWRLVATHAPHAISVHDIEGRFKWASPAFTELVGIDPDELEGEDAYERFHPEDVAAVRASHESVVSAPPSRTVEYRIQRGDGSYAWVETTSRSVKEESVADEAFIVAVTRPLQARKSIEQTLEAYRTVAERMDQLQREHDAFLTTIAHRFRQPLTIVAGMVEVLKRQWADMQADRREELFDVTDRNVHQLQDLVEQVTRADQLRRRVAELQVRPVSLASIVQEEVAAVSDLDGPVDVSIADDIVVFADPELLSSCLQILLANALQHTPLGCSVWVRAETADDGTVLIVEDDGPGVDIAMREQIFEPFTQSDRGRHDPGLGLGLHAAAEIAALHRGRIWVEDRASGQGASFRLLVPQVSDDAIQHLSDLTEVAD